MGMDLVLVPPGQKEEKSREGVEKALVPLRNGSAVTLVVRDSIMFRKKGVEPILLMIAPLRMYSVEGDGLLFSMPSYGSEILQIGKLTKSRLYRMGLSAKSASVLIKALNRLFEK